MGLGCRVEAVNLAKRYGSESTKLVIFEQLCFVAEPGEKLALVGESGAGKSTLLYLLGGLDRPTSGQILYEGVDITQLDDRRLADFRNHTLGFVWQTHHLLPEFTALENVSMPLRIRGVDRETAETAALDRLREVGLEARAYHLSGELSGGEQQRVVLARALVGRPKVLLADEPTGNLDARTGDRIIGLLDEMHQEHGLTSVYVTHNLSFARQCDRILELREGALVSMN
jgi:lipoprotein-releasing system ATP-binding protein